MRSSLSQVVTWRTATRFLSRGKRKHPGNQVVGGCNRSTGKKCSLFTHQNTLEFKPVGVLVQIELEFGGIWKCWFLSRGRKTGVSGEKPWEQGRELTTNLTHICRRRRDYQGLYDRTTRRQRKRQFKNEFAFFRSFSRLFQLIYFVKCRRTLPELNF